MADYFSSGSARKLWKEGFENKENVGSGAGEFDDGKYHVKLEKAYTAMSNSSNRPQNVMVFKFVNGDYKGQKVYSYQGLDNPTGIAIALAVLEKLGHEVTSPDEIDAADRKLSKEQPDVELRLQTRGDFQNKIVVAKLDDSDDSEEDEDDVDVEKDEDDEEDAAPAKKAKGKKADVAADEDEEDTADEDDEDSEESDDADDEDEDEDGKDNDEDEDEEKPVAKTKKVADKKAKKIVEEDDEDEETDDEADEDEDEDSEEEEVALEPGMKLKVKHDGETVKVKIIKVDEKAKEVRVKLADGSKITISVDDIVDVIS